MAAKQAVHKLVLVYAADSGKLSAFVDSARKLFRLKGCTLCSITHGLAGEKGEWRECREELGLPIDYLHRDELSGELRRVAGEQLPCVLAETDNGPVMLLGPDVLERCRGSVDDFKGQLLTHAAMRDLDLPG